MKTIANYKNLNSQTTVKHNEKSNTFIVRSTFMLVELDKQVFTKQDDALRHYIKMITPVHN